MGDFDDIGSNIVSSTIGTVLGGVTGGVAGLISPNIFKLPGTDVPAPPGPTSVQRQTEALALEQLQKDTLLKEQLIPLILSGLGFVQSPDGTVREMTSEERSSSLSAEQRSLEALGRSQIDTLFLNQGLAFDPETGETRQLSEEEVLSRLSPQERRSFEITSDLQTSLQSALSGDFTDPALEAQLEKQRVVSEEELSRRLGPGFKLSTPGIQTEAARLQGANIARDVSRRNEIGFLTGALSGRTEQRQTQEQIDLGSFGTTSGIRDQDRQISAGLLGNVPNAGGSQVPGLLGLSNIEQGRSDLAFSGVLQSEANKQARFNSILNFLSTTGGTAAGLGIRGG